MFRMWHCQSLQGIECHQFREQFRFWGLFSRIINGFFMSGLEGARQFVVYTMT